MAPKFSSSVSFSTFKSLPPFLLSLLHCFIPCKLTLRLWKALYKWNAYYLFIYTPILIVVVVVVIYLLLFIYLLVYFFLRSILYLLNGTEASSASLAAIPPPVLWTPSSTLYSHNQCITLDRPIPCHIQAGLRNSTGQEANTHPITSWELQPGLVCFFPFGFSIFSSCIKNHFSHSHSK